MVRQWAIQVSIQWTTREGWHTSKHMPMFYLHPNVQGIVDQKHAESIALGMFSDLVPVDADNMRNVQVIAHADLVAMLED
jgi:hypothetical protein